MSSKNPEDEGYRTSDIDSGVPECYSTVVENPEDSKIKNKIKFNR